MVTNTYSIVSSLSFPLSNVSFGDSDSIHSTSPGEIFLSRNKYSPFLFDEIKPPFITIEIRRQVCR